MDSDTLPKILKRNYEKYGDRTVALREKDHGIWRCYTWREYYENTKFFFYGLVSLGFHRGDTLAIIGEGKPQVCWSELAAHAAGGIVTGIFADCRAEEVKYFVEHSDSSFVVAQDQEQVDKLLDVKDQLPGLKKIVYWEPEGLWFYDDPILIDFTKLLDLGREYEKMNPGLFEKEMEKGTGEDTALMLYTSGTTGLPKGVMVCHTGIIAFGQTMADTFNESGSDELVSFAPMAWVAGQGNDFAAPLVAGMTVNYPEKAETVMENIREIAPNVIAFGPSQWEDIVRTIQAKIMDAHPLKRFFYYLFLPVGYKVADSSLKKANPIFLFKALHYVAYLVVFRPLLDKFGLNRIRGGLSGGTAISPGVLRLLQAIGVKVVQGYGSSDFGFATIHKLNDIDWETSGTIVPGMQVNIAADGEILIKNDVKWSCGYHKAPDAYSGNMVNGWFRSGDFGYLNKEGHLIVVDRMKDMRQVKGGEKFSPQFTEIRLRFSPFIKNALVIGTENTDYVSALINIDIENVGRWAEARRIVYTTFTDLSQKKEVIDLVCSEIRRVNKALPEHVRIQRFINLHKPLDADEAELTRTRKVRRTFLEDRYQNLTDALYGEATEIEVEIPITYRDGRTGMTKGLVKVNYAV